MIRVSGDEWVIRISRVNRKEKGGEWGREG